MWEPNFVKVDRHPVKQEYHSEAFGASQESPYEHFV
jgi:hypothetical protein